MKHPVSMDAVRCVVRYVYCFEAKAEAEMIYIPVSIPVEMIKTTPVFDCFYYPLGGSVC